MNEDGDDEGASCLNCGTMLAGNYCHACGQTKNIHKSISSFSHDLLHGVFHFDGKLRHTLPLLAWRPGELTRRYIDGERARFLSPLALFLLAVFIIFATLNLFDSGPINFATSGGRPGATPRIESDLALLNDFLIKMRENPALMLYKFQSNAYKYAWVLILPSGFIMWLLYAFNRRFALYDHLIFVTYSLGFMMLLMAATLCVSGILSSLGAPADAASLVQIAYCYVPVHIYRQLRGAYASSWIGALWRTIALLPLSFMLLNVFAIGMAALGAWD